MLHKNAAVMRESINHSPANGTLRGIRSPIRLGIVCTLVLAIVSLVGVSRSISTPAQTAGGDTSIAGTWRGALGTGAAQLHLVLTITRLGNGEYSGQLNSVDQGAVLPVDAVSLQSTKFRFEVKPIGGVYEGTLNDARTETKGTWTQANVQPQPLAFQRDTSGAAQAQQSASAASPAEAGFAGTWDSVAKPGEKQQFTLTIMKLGNAEYTGHVTLLDEGVPHSFDVVTVQGDSIHMELKAYGGVYEGMLSKDRNTIEGTWTAGGAPAEPVSFTRNAKNAAAASDGAPLYDGVGSVKRHEECASRRGSFSLHPKGTLLFPAFRPRLAS
jgi:hypothetical protein